MNKNLGILSYEEKLKICWNDKSMSGSRFKKWVLEPNKWKEKFITNPLIEEKMEWGNLLEPIIRKKIEEKLGLGKQVISNEETYQNIKYPFAHANIDGGYENPHWKALIILEIKNTVIGLMEVLYEEYKYQMMYYSWFWKEETVYLTVLVDGWEIKIKPYNFIDDWDFVEEKMKEFAKYIKDGIIPVRDKIGIVKNSIQKELNYVNDNIERIKSENVKLKLYKKIINNHLNNLGENPRITLKNGYVNQSKRKGSYGYDVETLNNYFEENDIDKFRFMKKNEDNKVLKINIEKIGEQNE